MVCFGCGSGLFSQSRRTAWCGECRRMHGGDVLGLLDRRALGIVTPPQPIIVPSRKTAYRRLLKWTGEPYELMNSRNLGKSNHYRSWKYSSGSAAQFARHKVRRRNSRESARQLS